MKLNYLKLSVFLFTLVNASWASSGWTQGAFLIHEISGGVGLSELGKSSLDVESADLPVGIRGRFTCQADPGAAVFLSASNRMFVQLQGPGEFGVERFEQTEPEPSVWSSTDQESGQSRMLFSLRSGNLFMDTRELNETSRVAVETPIGRIAVGRALWQMRIDFDQRSGIFSFEIACSEGSLSFTSRRDSNYPLRAGQRLSGAGGWTDPGVDVVEMTTNNREAIEEFLSTRSNAKNDAARLEYYLRFMDELLSGGGAPIDTRTTPRGRGDAGPVIIEYAPKPETLTPFRGEIPAPSESQADIF